MLWESKSHWLTNLNLEILQSWPLWSNWALQGDNSCGILLMAFQLPNCVSQTCSLFLLSSSVSHLQFSVYLAAAFPSSESALQLIYTLLKCTPPPHLFNGAGSTLGLRRRRMVYGELGMTNKWPFTYTVVNSIIQNGLPVCDL